MGLRSAAVRAMRGLSVMGHAAYPGRDACTQPKEQRLLVAVVDVDVPVAVVVADEDHSGHGHGHVHDHGPHRLSRDYGDGDGRDFRHRLY